MKPIVALLIVLPGLSFAQKPEPKWTNLLPKVDTKSGAGGMWTKTEGGLETSAAKNSRIALSYRPGTEYDFRIKFTRTTGVHSIALIFPCGKGQASFELDGWGKNLAGIQNIAGKDFRSNATRTANIKLENGRSYTARVEVRKGGVRAYLDDKLLCTYRGDGASLGMLPGWRIADAKSLGLGAYDAKTMFHSVEVRNVTGKGDAIAAKPKPNPMPMKPATNTGSKGKVLLVIANDGFFYREYFDPKTQLEKAGFQVVVAAGHKAMCVPHPNSGQTGNGRVMPDIVLSDAKAADYKAIVFSGGWGSSMYQFAFQGNYNNRNYNGTKAIKQTANKLINDFVSQKKFVGGICHGVSVLAWSRVNGKSLLAGKTVAAPPIQGPPGVYFGKRSQPASRWNSEVNGAKLTRPKSIGDPRTATDDVAVDGRILTAEDDKAARHFGIILSRLLLQREKK